MSAIGEQLSAMFLAELQALDAFAARREAEGGLLPGRDDPDVRRILEAMAFFSARTRAAAAAATRAAVRRIAAGTLDDLLAVSPAATMVQAVPDGGLLEPAGLPAGTLLRVSTPEGKVGLFSTARPLMVLPIEIEGAALSEVRRRLRLTLRLRALRPIRGAVELPIYVRRFNDYRASLALHDAIEQHVVRAFAEIDGGGREVPCGISFGAEPPRRLVDEAGEPGALARIRAFFHQPEQDLFVHVSVPAAPSPWSALAIHVELDEAFPADLGVSRDAFHLFVVPAVNAWTDLSAPILCDGTRDGYPVQSPSAVLEAVELTGVRGVYRSDDRGRSPILPAALAQGAGRSPGGGQSGDTYELEEDEEGGPPRLRLQIAGAFEKPAKVQVDARWSQPALWSSAVGRLAIVPQTRHLPAVSFRALGALRRPEESPLARDPARCLDVLSLRMRPALSQRDLVGMLEILGTGADGPYRGAHALVDALEVAEAPDPARRAAGIRRVYRLALRRRSPEDAPLLRRLAVQVVELLDAWTEDPVDVEVDARADAPRRALPAGGGRP
ncbi:type VI secretion system baseplate subunit TssF [Sorangium sp. So ce375]|uniref:type VI secretion system baseplate subunit TssF n=1 Tax=Sorangium sp. So ce375 TaxID=3133306 RepID=UPI003F5B507B